MKPSICRDVIVHGLNSNGVLEHPAKITRVWAEGDTAEGPVMVNVTVFPDCGQPIPRGSVRLYESKEEALAAQTISSDPMVAYWPPRV